MDDLLERRSIKTPSRRETEEGRMQSFLMNGPTKLCFNLGPNLNHKNRYYPDEKMHGAPKKKGWCKPAVHLCTTVLGDVLSYKKVLKLGEKKTGREGTTGKKKQERGSRKGSTKGGLSNNIS